MKKNSMIAPRRYAIRRLGWEILAVLAIKVTLIVLASHFLFGSAQRVKVTPPVMAQKIFSDKPAQ